MFRDLLINVTQFFRDTPSFEILDQLVIPKLIAEGGADDTIRVWVPGCATGEEAYSVAILTLGLAPGFSFLTRRYSRF